MKKRIAIALFGSGLCFLRSTPANAQTPGWQYYQCTTSTVSLTTSFQQIGTCIGLGSMTWPYTLTTNWEIFPIGVMDITLTATADLQLKLQVEPSTGCTQRIAAWDYGKFIPNRRQLCHVNEILNLNGATTGASFPSGCAFNLYAKTAVTSHFPTFNGGASDGSNLAIAVVTPAM